MEAKQQFNLPNDANVSKQAIWSHLKPNHKLLIAQPGLSLLMLRIEPLLLNI